MRFPVGVLTTLVAVGATLLLAMGGGVVTHRMALEVAQTTAEEQMARALVIAAAGVPGASDADSLMRAMARSSGYRVSLLDAESRFIADSDFPGAEVSTVPASDMSEVRTALLRVSGASRRASPLDGRPSLFSARRVFWGGQTAVLRFGMPVDALADRARAATTWTVLAILGLGTVVVVLVGVAGRRTGAYLGRLAAFLRRLSDGDARPPGLPLTPLVELAQVTSVVNRLSTEMEGQLSEVHRELAELTALMDQVAEGLLALTEDARVLRINPAGRRLLGVTVVVPFSPVGAIVRDPQLRDLLEASVVRPELEAEVTLGDRVLQVKTRSSEGGGSVVLLLDVTEVRRLEAVRTDFVANASHELKTPLTVIRGAAETVLQGELPDELRVQFLQSIQGNAVRLQRLVEDLLDLSRFESGAWRPSEEPVDLAGLARSVWSDVSRGGRADGVEFQVSGQGIARGDESAVYQVFQNLLDNAIRYVPEDGEILVEIRPVSDVVEIGVLDNGSGIPASALPRIFERFYRVDAARSRQEGGTGLGLAIVRHLVTSMGGRVWAESTLGLGTAMRFTLPAADAPSEADGDPR